MIDPREVSGDGGNDAAYIAGLLRAVSAKHGTLPTLDRLADAFDPEPTKPTKPEEPTGRYAVVQDSSGAEWVRADLMGLAQWKALTFDRWSDYASIDAVEVLSRGVQ